MNEARQISGEMKSVEREKKKKKTKSPFPTSMKNWLVLFAGQICFP